VVVLVFLIPTRGIERFEDEEDNLRTMGTAREDARPH